MSDPAAFEPDIDGARSDSAAGLPGNGADEIPFRNIPPAAVTRTPPPPSSHLIRRAGKLPLLTVAVVSAVLGATLLVGQGGWAVWLSCVLFAVALSAVIAATVILLRESSRRR